MDSAVINEAGASLGRADEEQSSVVAPLDPYRNARAEAWRIVACSRSVSCQHVAHGFDKHCQMWWRQSEAKAAASAGHLKQVAKRASGLDLRRQLERLSAGQSPRQRIWFHEKSHHCRCFCCLKWSNQHGTCKGRSPRDLHHLLRFQWKR